MGKVKNKTEITNWVTANNVMIPMPWGPSQRNVRSNGETSQVYYQTSLSLPYGDDLHDWLKRSKDETSHLVDATIEFWPADDREGAELSVRGWAKADKAQHKAILVHVGHLL